MSLRAEPGAGEAGGKASAAAPMHSEGLPRPDPSVASMEGVRGCPWGGKSASRGAMARRGGALGTSRNQKLT